jgi:OFA family oxalate/formate antiporter-like MFS transporter
MKAKRWLYLFIGTVILLFLGLIYAWSLFRDPFGQVYSDWTVTQMSMTFTISIVCFCLGSFAGGQLSGKLGISPRLVISGICLLIGFFMVSMLDPHDSASSLIRLYIFYGGFGGFGVGVGYNAVLTSMTKWFPDKVGLASGVMLMGFGLGGLVLGSIVRAMIASSSIFHAFRVLAFASAAVLILGAAVIRTPSEEDLLSMKKNVSEEDDSDELRPAPSVHNYEPGEMIRTSRFWIMFLWSITMSSAGLMVINSAANISVAYGGTAILGMVVSLFNGAGRIVAGNNYDSRGRRFAMIINTCFITAAGILLIAGNAADSLVLIVIGLILTGLAYGGTPAIHATYINRAFGPENYTRNHPLALFSLLPAAIIGPMISAALYENAGGTYGTNFIALLVFALVSLVVWMLLNIASRKSDNEGYR